MAQRHSLRSSRGIVAGVLAALSSMMHRGQPVKLGVGGSKRDPGFRRINWLKLSLNAR